MSVIGHDGLENCPTCGSIVCVIQDDEREGTSHYEPVGQSQVERLRSQLAGAVASERERIVALIRREADGATGRGMTSHGRVLAEIADLVEGQR